MKSNLLCLLLILCPLALPAHAQDAEPSQLIVINGYLLRVTGDEVKVVWIHPAHRPWKGMEVAPHIDTRTQKEKDAAQ